jgi:hypothetical protein
MGDVSRHWFRMIADPPDIFHRHEDAGKRHRTFSSAINPSALEEFDPHQNKRNEEMK